MQMLGDREPRTRLAAQMSLPYSVAVALVTGRASLTEYEDTWLMNGPTRALMGTVDMRVDASLPEGTEPYVTITTRDGQQHTGHVDVGRGAPENPLPAAEVIDKYRELAARSLPPASVRSLEAITLSLDDAPDVDTLLDALRAP
jgi:2-methylcitrate dehydratase PrpD